jgi:general L-amino acid transport system permease protein
MTDVAHQSYPPGSHPDLPAPRRLVGPVAWVFDNLLSSPLNIVLTAVCLILLYLVLPPLLDWTIFSAHWGAGESIDDCKTKVVVDGVENMVSTGACWTMIRARFGILMYGYYPFAERWRVDVAFVLQIIAMAGLLTEGVPYKKYWAIFLFVIYPIAAFVLFHGGFGLPVVETHYWGGLMLTLIVATTGIVASLPIGIVLALGRRSRLPIIRALSIAFIEFVRGVPLITILFMSSVVFPLFLPEGMNFDKLLRAMVGIALFSAAYLAEVVRGGLQAIPKGQYEGAMSLGLNYWKTNALIILPQAIQKVIPGIVNSFIGLFMDTTLVLIIGLQELLGQAQASAHDPHWLGTEHTALAFVSIVYFTFCFAMSRYSQFLERKLAKGYKR